MTDDKLNDINQKKEEPTFQDVIDELEEESIIKAEKDVDSLMEEFDKETSRLRKLQGNLAKAVMIIAIGMSFFHLPYKT